MMNIQGNFPTHVCWRVPLSGLSSGLELFNGTARNHLKKAFQLLEGSEFRFVFEEVTPAYVDRYSLLHADLMKERGDNFTVDFQKLILHRPINSDPHKALSLYEGDKYLGGMIFKLKPKYVALGYRVLPHKISLYLPAPLARMADVVLMDLAITHKLPLYSLGKDRNFFGINAAIGLAGYKLMSNAYPYISKKTSTTSIFSWDMQKDVLLFEGESGTNARKAKLFLTDIANQAKYHFLKKDFLEVETILPSYGIGQ